MGRGVKIPWFNIPWVRGVIHFFKNLNFQKIQHFKNF